ncbi:unnamed protein product [Symbiodinium sp. CCMP2592]|nr:unnamed protein product [Symbiodinium sp. CCMP2592]
MTGVNFLQRSAVSAPQKALTTERCLRFMHIPKTGGTSIDAANIYLPAGHHAFDSIMLQAFLRADPKEVDMGAMFDLAHSSSLAYDIFFATHPGAMREIPPNGPDACEEVHTPPPRSAEIRQFFRDPKCTTFCAVREPLSRYMEAFKMFYNECDAQSLESRTLGLLSELRSRPYMNNCMFITQAEYVYGTSDETGATPRFCQRILHTENLTEGFAALMAEFGRDVKLPDTHFMASWTDHCNMTADDLTPRTRAALYEHFKASALERALVKGLAKDLQLSSLPKVLQNNVCVPAGCSQQDIADNVLPLFYEAVLFRHWSATVAVARSRNLLLNVGPFVSIHEMGHWQDLQLDFAILGVDHCGTTSLHRHLSEHPSIVFAEEGEDWFFWNKARRLLPHRSWISDFESRMAAAAAAKRTLTGSSPRIGGIVNPRFFFNALLRKALSLIPQLKVLVIVCDPLGRLERRYADFSACATRGSVGPDHPPCSEQVQDLLEHRHAQLDWLWRSSETEQPLTSTFQLFSHRTLLLHRDWMRDAPGLFFQGVANFLGVSWEELPSFRRFNAWGGHRTDLCRNRTLTRALRIALEPEYAALQRFLELSGALPSALRLRRSRCEEATSY